MTIITRAVTWRWVLVAALAPAAACAPTDAEEEEFPTSDVSSEITGPNCASVKEGKKLTLYCPQGQTISGISFANYGTSTGTCGSFQAGSCRASNSRSVVEAACLGKNVCAIQANAATFGDPCTGTRKFLSAEAICSSGSSPPPVPPPPDVDPPPPPTGGKVLWQDKFDTAVVGKLDKARGDGIFGPTAAATGTGTYANGAIVDDGASGKLLRHTIAAGQLGPFIVSPRLTRETDHATLDYDIRFDGNFDWRWGGKMGPGLAGVLPGHGIYEPTSGNADRNIGFSTRLMWHGRGDDGSRPFQGKLGPIPAGSDSDVVTYIYARYPFEGFSGFGWHKSLGDLQRGTWHHVKMEVKLNTVGQRNGVFNVWLDGDLAYGAKDFDYRSSPNVHIQAVLYDVHRGGGTTPPSWVSSRDCYVDIKNVVVADPSL